MKFDALFIDFYGTLASGDRHAVEDTCATIVRDLSLPLTAAEFTKHWGDVFFAHIERHNHDSFRNLYECELLSLTEALQPWAPAADAAPYCRRLKAFWANPGLHVDSLDALQTLGLPVCCVSNADTEDLLAAATLHGLRFDAIVTSEDVRCYKPAAGIFERALEVMQVAPSRVLHVGDSLHSDVGGAAALGIATAWICREHRIYDIGQAQADHTIASLAELQTILNA